MYFFGRGISAFFNQLFKWLFWNKTGQKILFTIVVFTIAVCFIKLGEVSAVEVVEDVNYKVYNYYDSILEDFIFRFNIALNNNDSLAYDILNSINNGDAIYLFYGQTNGGSYNNSYPVSRGYLCLVVGNNSNIIAGASATSSDYMSSVGFTQYSSSVAHKTYRFTTNGTLELNGNYSNGQQTIYFPLQLFNRKSQVFVEFINAFNNNDTETIIELLTSIEENLSNTTPDQESEDSVVVDSSVAESVDSSAVDSVFSSAFTNFANKFTYYDLSDADQWVINIQGTRIVLRSDIIYNIIKNTWFYPMLQLLWYYIFGHYAFVWLTNLIHKIKDGSILDGMQMNEVISKEML